MSYSEHSTTPSLPTLTTRTARLAVAVVALLALGACGGDPAPEPAVQSDTGSRPGSVPLGDDSTDSPTVPPAEDPTTDETSAPETASPTEPEPDPEPDPVPELIVYAGGEAVPPLIEDRAGAKQLTGAPEDFQDFVGRAAEEVSEQADCDGAAVGITVDVIRTDGFAAGGVNECGGYAAMWAKVDGAWQEIQGTQDTWDCAVLKQYRVPSDILLGSQTCFDYEGDKKEHAYHQA